MNDEMRKWNDAFEGGPAEDGWYAVHYSWDANEGSFVGAIRLEGGQWTSRYPLLDWTGPFRSEQEADDWARANDKSF